jgi:hypothetical protein
MTTKESKRLISQDGAGREPAPAETPAPAHRKRRPRLEDKPHGSRGDYFKITVNLSPEVYELFSSEIAHRKKTGRTGGTVSGIIRELALRHLVKHGVEE